ncbi:Uncharacterised protein [Mycobacterium tuberculosis]|nr:Uncharacterised protein [Mycobacterium tuberculosis]CKV10627.1 Uncharacterised protein [Mycobacterium tuberculosis]CNV72366.1 Uncharacterised protein [Mycobacterium tuberculosis]COU61998.1 Uncharacterised protein [Mycobacterium tuberculosis]COW10508.1 Uncharacterised protein [Mycobacterium tuberculosis]
MRAPRCGTMMTCFSFGRSPEVVVVLNSTRRRISRRTTRISTMAKVAPRQRRLPPPNGNQVVGLKVAPTIRSGSNRSGSGYSCALACTSPIAGTTMTPAGSR